MASSSSSTLAENAARDTRSNLKIPLYLPPRIDSEMFQAEVPQLIRQIPDYDPLLSARAIHDPAFLNSSEVQGNIRIFILIRILINFFSRFPNICAESDAKFIC